MFKKLSTRSVYKNKWTEVFEDEIEFPNGQKGIYGYAVRSDGAAVAVVNDKNEVLLLKQYRYPIHEMEWNLPGGGIDSDTPEQAAIREVKEETGVEINSVEKLTAVHNLSSFLTEKEYIFLARVGNVELLNEDVSDDDELMVEKRFIPIKDALKMIDNGELLDSTTANAIQIVARKLNIN